MLPTTPPALLRIAEHAAEVVVAAGDLLLDFYDRRDELTIHDKSAGGTQDLVSNADHAADALLREQLPHVCRVPYWSEESGSRPDSDACWLADPLDGTNNFLNGMPLFGVSLALLHRGAPVVAALRFPALGLTLHAARGAGAYLDGRRVSLAPQDYASWIIEVNAQPGDADPLQSLLKLGSGVRAVRVFGSIALSLAWVAGGQLDLWVGRGYPWDVAAGILALEEAGGVAFTLGGVPRQVLERDVTMCGHPATVREALRRISA